VTVRAVGEPAFPSFCEAVRELLDETAADKGYQQTGLTGPNPMYAFVAETAGDPGHALGEIVYKVRRYSSRRHGGSMTNCPVAGTHITVFERPKEEEL
jgi:hypothetical protein